jgi:hypothetical protein
MDSALNARRPSSIFTTRPFLVDPSPKSTRPASWIKWLVFVALLLASLTLIIWSLPGTSSKIQARINAIKKAGYPVTAQDLDKMYPPVPENQNSVVIYQKAFSQITAPPANATNWPIVSDSTFQFRTRPLPADVKQGMADYVDQNEATLKWLHQAAGIEKGYYDPGFKNGFPNVGRIPFMQIRENAQLLALAVILRAEDRQPGAATALLQDSLGLPRSLENDPRLISQMIRDAIVGLSCSSLELTLNKTPLTDDELRSLAAVFHKTESSGGIKRSLICERCEGFWLRDQLTANPFSRPDESLKGKLYDLYFRAIYYRESDFIFYLDIMEKYMVAADLPNQKRFEVARQLTSQVRESKENGRAYAVLFAEWDKVFLTDARTRAKLLLSEAALAIERYRLANHNLLPPALQDVVPAFLPAVPLDPFDGKPLRYQLLPKGYLIYSIGEDGVDNGGKEWDPEKQTGDRTFTVER